MNEYLHCDLHNRLLSYSHTHPHTNQHTSNQSEVCCFVSGFLTLSLKFTQGIGSFIHSPHNIKQSATHVNNLGGPHHDSEPGKLLK
jgi:hypothetical protein